MCYILWILQMLHIVYSTNATCCEFYKCYMLWILQMLHIVNCTNATYCELYKEVAIDILWIVQMLLIVNSTNATYCEFYKCYILWIVQMLLIVNSTNATYCEFYKCNILWNLQMLHIVNSTNATYCEFYKCYILWILQMLLIVNSTNATYVNSTNATYCEIYKCYILWILQMQHIVKSTNAQAAVSDFMPETFLDLKETCNCQTIKCLCVSSEKWDPLEARNTPKKKIQSTLVISKSKGPAETLRDIRTLTYQMWRIEENTELTTKFHKWTCYLTPLIRNICWKYCGKGEKLLLRSNFSPYPQYFITCC